jgi:hypothetical protein
VFKSLRGRSGKTGGGQVGHKGDTLRPVDKPDRVERHAATACRHCQACLTAPMPSLPRHHEGGVSGGYGDDYVQYG